MMLKKDFIYHIMKSIGYSYLMDDGKNDKKAKGTKTCVIKKNT